MEIQESDERTLAGLFRFLKMTGSVIAGNKGEDPLIQKLLISRPKINVLIQSNKTRILFFTLTSLVK